METMAEKMVSCTNRDCIRIDILGADRAVTVPAKFILAVLLMLQRCEEKGVSLDIDLVSEGSTVPNGWQATLDMGQEAIGPPGLSPWRALQNLAEEIL
jgi:hypothetical protein